MEQIIRELRVHKDGDTLTTSYFDEGHVGLERDVTIPNIDGKGTHFCARFIPKNRITGYPWQSYITINNLLAVRFEEVESEKWTAIEFMLDGCMWVVEYRSRRIERK